tara:strand:+ start:1364 stop:1837 length:474 start_codon:yes stop_codon:yes gene_type:complete
MNIEVKKINIHRGKNLKLIEKILKNWFKSPKNLNFSEPNSKYPFNFKKWIKKFYLQERFQSFFLKENDWIICLIIIEYLLEEKILIKHVSCEPNYNLRGENLILFLDNFLMKFNNKSISQIMIEIVKGDTITAERILESGFTKKREGGLTNLYYKKL